MPRKPKLMLNSCGNVSRGFCMAAKMLHVRLDRNTQREGASFARRAFRSEITSEQAGELTRDAEAKAGPRRAMRVNGAHLSEGFEDGFQIFAGDADPGVRHRADQDLLVAPQF